jgi:hypothetical protein
MNKVLVTALVICILLVEATPVSAASYPWRDHAKPFDFLFGNEIDTHQQSRKVGGEKLQGSLYIHYTGETIDGIPVAEHMDCNAMPASCVAGWKFEGVKLDAMVVSPEMMPEFCAGAEDLANKQGYSHFHWLGDPQMGMDLVTGQVYSGYLMRLVAQSAFYFRHHDTLILVTPGIDTVSHANIQTCGG